MTDKKNDIDQRTAIRLAGAAAGAVASAMLPGVGAVVSAAGQAAIDAALAGPEVDLDKLKVAVDKNPHLQRREGESFHDWLHRLGLYGLTDSVHHLRRLQLRQIYTDSLLNRDRMVSSSGR